jgi:hypothetical protein
MDYLFQELNKVKFIKDRLEDSHYNMEKEAKQEDVVQLLIELDMLCYTLYLEDH